MIVRIGNRWRDQVVETGHRFRATDLALIAGLGIKTVRYPVLWESVAPDGPNTYDFAWVDERLSMFQDYGIEVIGGLLHHGSGPAYIPGRGLAPYPAARRMNRRISARPREWSRVFGPLFRGEIIG